MTGRITFVPTPAAVCDRPGGCRDKPHPQVHSRGTIWTCDECGKEWVLVTGSQHNETYEAWRPLTERNRDGSDR